MLLIDSVLPEKASGQVAEIYNDISKIFGCVPNAMQMYSSSPALLAQQWQGMGYYFSHPHLSRPLLAAIRLLVSQDNNCDYCIGFNASMLINMLAGPPSKWLRPSATCKQRPSTKKRKRYWPLCSRPSIVAKARLVPRSMR